jgi:hypothetical protein
MDLRHLHAKMARQNCLAPGYFPNKIPGYVSGEQGGMKHLVETHVEAEKRHTVEYGVSRSERVGP